MELLISLILPVYNVDAYLEECILSCIQQDIPSNLYEIILVLDGPTDESENIAQSYTLKYANVLVIKQENQGLSSARNTGMKYAQGKYIWFIDPDDYIRHNTLKMIVHKLESHMLDAFFINKQTVNEAGVSLKKIDVYEDRLYISGREFLPLQIHEHFYAWRYIFRKSFLEEHSLIFQKGILYEDIEMVYRMLYACPRLGCSSTVYYYYRIRKDSIMRQENNYPLRMNSIHLLLKNLEVFRKQINDENYLHHFDCRMINMASIFTHYYDITNTKQPKLRHEVLRSLTLPQHKGRSWLKGYLMTHAMPLYLMLLRTSKMKDKLTGKYY